MVEQLKKYVEYLKNLKNTGYVPTNEDKSVNYYVNSDSSLSELMKVVNEQTNIDEMIRLVEDFIKEMEKEQEQVQVEEQNIQIKQEELQKQEEVQKEEQVQKEQELQNKEQEIVKEQEVAKKQEEMQKVGISTDNLTTEQEQKIEQEVENKENTFINIKNVDHFKLNNGKEVYSFVDENGVRRVVENTNGQLNNQLTGDVLVVNELIANNNEVGMMPIDEFISNPDNFKDLDEQMKSNLNKIIENKDALNIRFINKANMLAVDMNGNLLESYFDAKTNTSNISTPQAFSYTSDNLEKNAANDNVGVVSSNVLNTEIKEGELQKEEEFFTPEEKEIIKQELEIRNLNIPLEQVISEMPKYYSNANLLVEDSNNGSISQEKNSLYNHLIDNMPKGTSNQKSDSIANKMVLTNPALPPSATTIKKDQKGIVSIFILAMVLFVIAAIILFNMKS